MPTVRVPGPGDAGGIWARVGEKRGQTRRFVGWVGLYVISRWLIFVAFQEGKPWAFGVMIGGRTARPLRQLTAARQNQLSSSSGSHWLLERDTAFHTAFHTAWLAGGALALGFGSNIYHYAEQRRARALPFFEEDRSKLATLCGAMWEFQSGVMAQGNAETTKTPQLRYDRMHDVVLKVRIYGKCRRGS